MKYFGIILIILWFLIFMAFSWDQKSSKLINIIIGAVSFVMLGAFYLVPAWLIFWR